MMQGSSGVLPGADPSHVSGTGGEIQIRPDCYRSQASNHGNNLAPPKKVLVFEAVPKVDV